MSVHATVTSQVRRLDGRPGPPTKIAFQGTLDPVRHAARLAIHIDRPPVDALFATQPASAAQAGAAVNEIVDAVIDNNFQRLARLLSPTVRGSESPAELARRLSSQGIRATQMRLRGPGAMRWLQSGYPLWVQPVVATAKTPDGTRTLRTNLLLVEQSDRWWLLGTASG
jgi:hypothetical protein